MNKQKFTGFGHSANELQSYSRTGDVFSLFLKNNKTSYLFCSRANDFELWLRSNNIPDVSAQPGNNYSQLRRSLWSLRSAIKDVFSHIKK